MLSEPHQTEAKASTGGSVVPSEGRVSAPTPGDPFLSKVHRLHLCQVSPGAAQEEVTGRAGISLSLEGRGLGLVILSGVTLTRAGPGEDRTGHWKAQAPADRHWAHSCQGDN